MDQLQSAVDTAIRRCPGVGPGDDVVVVADTTTRRTGNEAAAEAGADAVVMVMDPRGTDGEEPPPAVAAALGNIVEDEKTLGTLHVAFGASAGIGGTVTAPIHLGRVVLSPTLGVGGVRVLEAGAFLLDA